MMLHPLIVLAGATPMLIGSRRRRSWVVAAVIFLLVYYLSRYFVILLLDITLTPSETVPLGETDGKELR